MYFENNFPMSERADPDALRIEVSDSEQSSSETTSLSRHPIEEFYPATSANRLSRGSRSCTPTRSSRHNSVLHSPVSNPITCRFHSDGDSSARFPALAPIASAGPADPRQPKLYMQQSTPDSGMSSHSPSATSSASLRGRTARPGPSTAGWKRFGRVLMGMLAIPVLIAGVAALVVYAAAPATLGIVVAAAIHYGGWSAVGAGGWTLASAITATWQGFKARAREAEEQAAPQRPARFNSAEAQLGDYFRDARSN